jgi:hypothetical protein
LQKPLYRPDFYLSSLNAIFGFFSCDYFAMLCKIVMVAFCWFRPSGSKGGIDADKAGNGIIRGLPSNSANGGSPLVC